MKKSTSLLCGLALALPVTSASAQLFTDSFNSAASASNWSSQIWGTSDQSLTYGYDYSTFNYSFNGVLAPIPASPNGGGATTGLRISVNDTSGAATAINLYTAPSFSGDYTVRFDMWINYNGGSGGGSGSTENALFGVNHSGDHALRHASGTYDSDGQWFGVTGEGGIGPGATTTKDYSRWIGGGSSAVLNTADMVAFDHGDPFFSDAETGLFRTSETVGAAGKRWVEVELRYIDGEVSMLLDNTLVGTALAAGGTTSGKAMLGYLDIFAGSASPAADNFVIFDNFQVIPEPSTYALIAGLGFLGLAVWRRSRRSVA